MRANGITYDTGFVNAGVSTRERFDPAVVDREMRIVHDDLRCDAVRITGGDVGRLTLAASRAAEAGLEVWLSPFTCDLTPDQLLDILAQCAGHAELLRRRGAEVVVLTGSELSLSTIGFLPGEKLADRLELLRDPRRLRGAIADVPARVNDFLQQAATLVRQRFGGKVSYASLPFERVDWTRFDVISTDAAYRSADIADRFRSDIRESVARARALGKPLAVTEFGCTTYRGAGDLGGRGDSIVEWDDHGRPVGLRADPVRDENEQAKYLVELLDVFNAEGVDTAFVNTFARYDLPHSSDPRLDLDMASYGVVKVLSEGAGEAYPEMPWEPKASFRALAGYFGSS